MEYPVGVIRSTWGGTSIESWLSADSLACDPSFGVVQTRWQALLEKLPENQAAFDKVLAAHAAAEAAAKATVRPRTRLSSAKNRPPVIPVEIRPSSEPSSLFNGMINPLLPYALRGILWYQGESNTTRPSEYHDLFVELITSWRMYFEQGDLPFYWVQLPNFIGAPDSDWARLREAQTNALACPTPRRPSPLTSAIPTTFIPPTKFPSVSRLALLAKARDYGIAVRVERAGLQACRPGRPALRIFFDHAEGLIVKGAVHRVA